MGLSKKIYRHFLQIFQKIIDFIRSICYNFTIEKLLSKSIPFDSSLFFCPIFAQAAIER